MTTVFEIARLEKADLVARLHATMERFPLLRRFYDDKFLDELAGRRTVHNYLLWLLAAQRGEDDDDDYATRFWTSTLEDLELLKPEGSWERFAPKFRRIERFDISSRRKGRQRQ